MAVRQRVPWSAEERILLLESAQAEVIRTILGRLATGIPSAKILSLSVDKLTSGTVGADQVITIGDATGGTDPATLQSSNFSTGVSGWQVKGTGDAEFNSIVVRGNIQAGTGSDVDWSYISNVSIDNADITSLAFSKITAATNDASLVVGSTGTIGSSNYVANTSGWQIAGDGSAEFNNILARGTITTGGSSEAHIAVGVNDAGWIDVYGPAGAHNGRLVASSSYFFEVAALNLADLYLNSPNDVRFMSGGYMHSYFTGDATDRQIQMAIAGRAAAPSYSWYSDPNTGIYNSAADHIGFSTGGTLRGEFDSAGLAVVGSVVSTTGIFKGGADSSVDDYISIQEGGNDFSVYLDGVERFRVDTSGYSYIANGRLYMTASSGGNDWIEMSEASDYFRIVIDGWQGFAFYRGGSGTGDFYVNNMPDGSVSTYMKYNPSNDLVSYTSSSLTKKQNVRPLSKEYAIQKMKAIDPIIFDRIRGIQHVEGSGVDEVGYAAEDVDLILPDLVGKNKEGDPISVNHPDFVPYLHIWIKDLEERLAALESGGQ